MEQKFVKVNIESLVSTKKLIDASFSDLLSLLKRYKKMVDNTKKIYNTETGELYRKYTNAFLDCFEKYLNKYFKSHVDELNFIIKEYDDTYEFIEASTTGGNK